MKPSRGSKHGLSKLTEEKVAIIRNLHAGGFTQAEIARELSVARQTVAYAIKKGWRHVK